MLTLYLLVAIGFRGGAELAHVGLEPQVVAAALSGIALGVVVPLVAFLLLTRLGWADPLNAGAIAAHYGSISIVTFVTANAFLSHLGVAHAGYMVAVVALMEAPGILVGVLLARAAAVRAQGGVGLVRSLGPLARETLLGGSVLLLSGSFAIGALSGEQGLALVRPMVVDAFPGALAFFLLDMGLTVGRQMGDFLAAGRWVVGFGVGMPLIGASLGVAVGRLAGLGVGDATLLATLAASASYIAAPAVVRLALPSANAALPVTLALGVTFPFNVLVGMPLYYAATRALVGS